MPHFTLSPAAEDDISSILAWTHRRFGERARIRYEALLVQAIVDVADDPERSRSVTREEIVPSARTYHLFHSRNRVDGPAGRVRRPRHFLVYPNRPQTQVTLQVPVEIMQTAGAQMLQEGYMPQSISISGGGEGPQFATILWVARD